MDWVTVALSALGGVGSGAIAAVAYSFILGRKYQQTEDKLKNLEAKNEEQDKKIEKLDTDQDAMTKENHESWQELNRSLGQVQGILLGGLPPPLPPRKSRPGT